MSTFTLSTVAPRLAKARDDQKAWLVAEDHRVAAAMIARELRGLPPAAWRNPARDTAARFAKALTAPDLTPPPPRAKPCPHCHLVHDGRVISYCRDNDPWTNAERDERDENRRRRFPAIHGPDYRNVGTPAPALSTKDGRA